MSCLRKKMMEQIKPCKCEIRPPNHLRGRECYKSVTKVFQECYKGVTRLLQECWKGVTKMLQVVLQGCYKSEVLQECYKSVARALQR
jgi:hypothetical protein